MPGDLAARDHFLLRRLSRKGGFTGQGTNTFTYIVKYGNPQGVSGTFADAQTGAKSSKGVAFSAVRRRKYGVITLDGEAMASSRDDKGAFMTLVTTETDGVLEEMGDTFAFDLYRAGDGMRGRAASIASNVITLTIPDDARNFKVGMRLIGDNDIAGGSPHSGDFDVVAVDEDAGTVEVDNIGDIASFTTNDYLFRIGDPGTCMEGLEDHFPLTAPVFGSDSFRGVDRGTDARRLAGVRIDDTASSIEDNIGKVAIKISQVGKKANMAVLNPLKYWEVVRRLGAKIEYDGGGGGATHAFEFFSVSSPAGTLRAYSDADCPTNRGYVMNDSKIYIKHLDPFPHIISDDGRPNLRQVDADGIEARARGWSNTIVTEPGCFGVFSI
jgi:hypothetical protein